MISKAFTLISLFALTNAGNLQGIVAPFAGYTGAHGYAGHGLGYSGQKTIVTKLNLQQTHPSSIATQANYHEQIAAPLANYGAPLVNYGAPFTKYSAPIANYAAPITNYGAPLANYGAPLVHYGAPLATYGAHLASPIGHYAVNPIVQGYAGIGSYGYGTKAW